LNRDAAEACEVFIDFLTWGDEASRTKVFDTISGRWDSHPEPWSPIFEVEPDNTVMPQTGKPSPIKLRQTAAQFEPSRVTFQQDISVGSDRGRISVAVLRDGEAFAFANESYMYLDDHFGKPDWKLTQGTTYRVDVRVKGSNAAWVQAFKLEYLNNNFADFKLQSVRS
jgi:hypothetical protein